MSSLLVFFFLKKYSKITLVPHPGAALCLFRQYHVINQCYYKNLFFLAFEIRLRLVEDKNRDSCESIFFISPCSYQTHLLITLPALSFSVDPQSAATDRHTDRQVP